MIVGFRIHVLIQKGIDGPFLDRFHEVVYDDIQEDGYGVEDLKRDAWREIWWKYHEGSEGGKYVWEIVSIEEDDF